MDPSAPSAWSWLWRHVVGAAALIILGWRTFGSDSPLLPLTLIELAFHESSHWATIWAPRVIYFLAGSVGQILIPLLIAAHLWVRMRDPLGGALGIGWAGLSAHGVAVYVADAPYERLQLVGGNTHDWAYLLGPEQFDAIDAAGRLATAINGMGIAMVVAGVLVCLASPVVTFQRASRNPDAPLGSVHWQAERADG